MPRHAGLSLMADLPVMLVARTGKGRIELTADQFFNKFPRSFPHSSFNRIKPIVEKLGSRVSFTLRGMRLRDIAGHGVVSGPAL